MVRRFEAAEIAKQSLAPPDESKIRKTLQPFKGKCNRCNVEGHPEFKCRKDWSKLKCNKCNEVGHASGAWACGKPICRECNMSGHKKGDRSCRKKSPGKARKTEEEEAGGDTGSNDENDLDRVRVIRKRPNKIDRIRMIKATKYSDDEDERSNKRAK